MPTRIACHGVSPAWTSSRSSSWIRETGDDVVHTCVGAEQQSIESAQLFESAGDVELDVELLEPEISTASEVGPAVAVVELPELPNAGRQVAHLGPIEKLPEGGVVAGVGDDLVGVHGAAYPDPTGGDVRQRSLELNVERGHAVHAGAQDLFDVSDHQRLASQGLLDREAGAEGVSNDR